MTAEASTEEVEDPLPLKMHGRGMRTRRLRASTTKILTFASTPLTRFTRSGTSGTMCPTSSTFIAIAVKSHDRMIVAYSIFKQNILPEWEKTNNINGSEWGCREPLSAPLTQTLWRNLVLACIGEQLPHVVGVRYINKCNRLRVIHKLEVWMNTTSSHRVQETFRAITRVLSGVQGLPHFTLMRHNEKQAQALEYTKRRTHK